MSIILFMLTQAVLSKAQIAAIEADRKVFEPYRQCVLTKARELYPTGNNFAQIFEMARKSCTAVGMEVTMDIAANAMERAMDAAGHNGNGADYGSDPMTMFSNELIFEMAKDFVPKVGN